MCVGKVFIDWVMDKNENVHRKLRNTTALQNKNVAASGTDAKTECVETD